MDKDVFEASNKQAYLKLCSSDGLGKAVVGLRAVRDAATHHEEVLEPNVTRAMGPREDGRFIISARWRSVSDLPSGYFHNVDGKRVEARESAYASHLAGRDVLDSLLDAFRFFNECDPKLVKLVDGQIPGFPLPPLELVGGYYRMHPDWNTHEEADVAIRKRATATVPNGESRSIVGYLDGGRILVGWTNHARGRDSFTEPVHEVYRDVRRGFSYHIEGDAGSQAVGADHGELVVEGHPIADLLDDESETDDPPWHAWAELCAEDATYYARQRH